MDKKMDKEEEVVRLLYTLIKKLEDERLKGFEKGRVESQNKTPSTEKPCHLV